MRSWIQIRQNLKKSRRKINCPWEKFQFEFIYIGNYTDIHISFYPKERLFFYCMHFFFKSNLSNIIFNLVKLKIKLYTLYFLRLILLRYSKLRKSQINSMHLHKCIFICSQFPFDTLQRTIMLTFFFSFKVLFRNSFVKLLLYNKSFIIYKHIKGKPQASLYNS